MQTSSLICWKHSLVSYITDACPYLHPSLSIGLLSELLVNTVSPESIPRGLRRRATEELFGGVGQALWWGNRFSAVWRDVLVWIVKSLGCWCA